MANTVDDMGTGTIYSTMAGPGSSPYVVLTGSFTSTSYINVTQRYPAVRDVEGPFVLSVTRINATAGRVYTDRQLPAGESIVFDWISTSG